MYIVRKYENCQYIVYVIMKQCGKKKEYVFFSFRNKKVLNQKYYNEGSMKDVIFNVRVYEFFLFSVNYKSIII